jgi:hypothetical protein
VLSGSKLSLLFVETMEKVEALLKASPIPLRNQPAAAKHTHRVSPHTAFSIHSYVAGQQARGEC